MERIKTTGIVVISLIIFLFTASVNTDDDSFMHVVLNKVAEYNRLYPDEKTFMLTDRFVYRPGDELWFKAFAFSPVSNQHYSNDLFIRLVSSAGEEVIYRRYPLQSNEADGRIIIPRSCIPGRYWLIGYTSWMKNQPPSQVFRKEILISKYFEKRFTVETLFDKLTYSKNDTLTAHIQIIDATGKPVPETNFDFSIGSLDKTGIRGNGITDIKGKAVITGVLDDIENFMILNIEIRGRKLWGDYSTIIPIISEQPDVTFFPEGGNLIAGVNNVVAFRALNKSGNPIQIAGSVVDVKGHAIVPVSTNVYGLGKFEFTPTCDTFYLKINQPLNIAAQYMIPPAKSSGTVVKYLGYDAEKAYFQTVTMGMESEKTCWIATSDGKNIWSSEIGCKGIDTVMIPLGGLTSGLLQVSVFNASNALAYDRMIMTDNRNQCKVKLQATIYHSRQRVNVLIEFPENMKTQNMALAVSLANLSNIKNSQAGLNPLITPKTMSAGLFNDLSMLTSAYRIINWKEIFGMNPTKEPYRKRDGLSGTVWDKKDNISQHAKIRVTNFPSFGLYETQSDEKGDFNIEFASEIIDFKFLNVDAYDAPGKTSLNAKIDFSYIESINALLREESGHINEQKIRDIMNYGEPDLVYVLRYGPGKFRTSHMDKRKKYNPYQYSRYTDVMDIIQDIQPYRLSGNRIIFSDRSKNRADSVSMEEAIIVINGLLKGNDISVLKTIVPSDITNINISNFLLDVHKYTPLNFGSVIEITTIQGLYKYRQSPVQMGPGILSTERTFYSPDYSLESSTSTDNRRTLYWNPKLTPKQGNSMLVTFYTSDVKGPFSGKLVGFDKDGNPVEGSFTFRVE